MERTKRALIGPLALLIGVLTLLGLVVRSSLGHPGVVLYTVAAKPRIQRVLAPHAKARPRIHSVKERTENERA
ncbi:MAG: hypothetical protein ABIY70_15215 [Capsulimonas sp.]|uniref:hypothetical protein n=1 Tax=Capsulimonas sp. TaxID=2494211 RepID=UPI003265C352